MSPRAPQRLLGLGTAQAGPERRGQRDRVDLDRRAAGRRSSAITPLVRAPRPGSTPPTTLVPPPNGTTATPSRAQASSRAATAPRRAGIDHGVGRVLERPAAQPDQIGIALARPRGGRGPRGRSARSPAPTASTTALGSGRASGSATSSSRPRGAGSPSPELGAQHRQGAAPSSGRLAGSPHPHHFCGRAAVPVSHRLARSARSIPASASSSRCAGRAPHHRPSPRREIPRSVSSLVSVTSVAAALGSSPISSSRRTQHALERRPLDLLLPDVARARGRGGAAEVGAHPGAALGLEHLGPLARARRPAPRTSSTRTARRPPARQVVRIGDQLPDRAPGSAGSAGCA